MSDYKLNSTLDMCCIKKVNRNHLGVWDEKMIWFSNKLLLEQLQNELNPRTEVPLLLSTKEYICRLQQMSGEGGITLPAMLHLPDSCPFEPDMKSSVRKYSCMDVF